jgi:hypothetical protein
MYLSAGDHHLLTGYGTRTHILQAPLWHLRCFAGPSFADERDALMPM